MFQSCVDILLNLLAVFEFRFTSPGVRVLASLAVCHVLFRCQTIAAPLRDLIFLGCLLGFVSLLVPVPDFVVTLFILFVFVTLLNDDRRQRRLAPVQPRAGRERKHVLNGGRASEEVLRLQELFQFLLEVRGE